jgi:hypothetical protein
LPLIAIVHPVVFAWDENPPDLSAVFCPHTQRNHKHQVAIVNPQPSFVVWLLLCCSEKEYFGCLQ